MRSLALLLAVLLAWTPIPARAAGENAPAVVKPEVHVSRLVAEGEYARAERKALDELRAETRLTGPGTLRIAMWQNWLGVIARARGNDSKALDWFRRALDIRRRTLGPRHADTVVTLGNTALVLERLGHYREAEPLMREAVDANTRLHGPTHARTVTSLSNLGLLAMDLGRMDEARTLLEDALDRTRRKEGGKSANLATSLSNLATLCIEAMDFDRAEALLTEALAIDEMRFGKEHPAVATTLNNLGQLYHATGRYTQANDAYLRAQAIDRKRLGPDHPESIDTLVNLASLYADTGRTALARETIEEALEAVGRRKGDAGIQAMAVMAELLRRQGRDADAQAVLWKAIAAAETRLVPGHPATAPLLMQLAATRFATGSTPRALAFKAHEIIQHTWGIDSAQAARSALQVADILQRSGNADDARTWALQARTQVAVHFGTASFAHARAQALVARASFAAGRLDEALVAMNGAMATLDKTLPARSTDRIEAHLGLARILAARGDPAQGLRHARIALQAVREATRLDLARRPRGPTINPTLERDVQAETLRLAMQAATRDTEDAGATAAAFDAADLLLASRTDRALALGALRSGLTGKGARERLDLLEQQRADLDRLSTQYIEALAGRTTPERLQTIGAQRASLESRMAATIKALEAEPDCNRFASPPRAGLADLRRQLQRGELLVMLVPLGQELAVLATTSTRHEIYTVQVTPAALRREVAALRAQLDPSTWTSTFAPFSRTKSHALFERLFGPLKGQLRSTNRLVILAGEPLAGLPFAALVTRPVLPSALADASPGPLRETPWLIRTHAIVSYPSLSAFVALRARPPRAPRGAMEILGIGAPPARADLNLAPLPAAAGELDSLRRLGTATLLTGEGATETALRNLDLTRAGLLAFATHALPGRTGRGDPALVLAPSPAADGTVTPATDGFLTPAEIATLSLKSPWVILSACNTAGIGAGDSGLLAEAFFRAGAGAVLQSNWPVFDRHAAALSRAAVRHWAASPRDGQAAALRKAMLEMLADRTHPLTAHPATWAAFSLVGEEAPR